ncbi:MalY/PatB family protein [Paracoccus shanxieyensis]|uniref:cysteine-S-conjugate beta-lyase n=1 Tax=Paracoccus shanxieyensis TaxID=2675752 RepID=A0A6L6ISZ6_9RHOB|nr:MalY/PatB family protein [Paracoccus shanxieyensis]MTH62728.1 putative C-S lyase [Paracoccus shanxieyensis]MTH86188.1 putative C-S lyase [Paracoccus shanxieyensis]
MSLTKPAPRTAVDFDEQIDRVGTACSKWDDMQKYYGVDPADGIPMWVADMDFRPPAVVQNAVEAVARHGIYGYPGGNAAYTDAICWWMQHRHGWQVQPDWIMTVHGLVNGTALCVDAFTQPGDAVVLMTPVYHGFARVIRANGRDVTEFPLVQAEGEYRMDWEGWAALMTGRERMLVLCSPHNPGGRVWSEAELRQVAEFCAAHDMILVSDEIHHDLVMPGAPRHMATALAAPEIESRLVTLTAATKTFNIAGAHIGNIIVSDPELRGAMAQKLAALGISPGLFGLHMVAAAYSPEGAAWVDELVAYLDGNRRDFDKAVNAIPGLRSMPLQSTYLAWVDFSGTGMDQDEIRRRIAEDAGIAASDGISFGQGGEQFMRFNLATTHARVQDAVARLARAFGDLQ